MAAPQKMGLDYYPRSVNLLKDRKFVKAKIKYGYLSIVVYDALLEMIYSDKGYYLEYNKDNKEDVIWDILECVRGKYAVEASTVCDVIEMLVECRLFSHDHFKQGIITSKRIQEVYYKATVDRKNVEVNPYIWMLTIPEMEVLSSKSSILSFFINRPINGVNRPINSVNQPINLQSKVNKSKVNKSKEDSITVSADTVCRADAQLVMDKWNELGQYGIKEVTKTDVNSKRYGNIVARIKANGLDIVLNAIDNIKKSKFLQGDNDRGWIVTFDWFIKPSNFQKVLEGNYDDRKPKNTPKPINNVFNNYDQRIYTAEEIDEIMRRKNAAENI